MASLISFVSETTFRPKYSRADLMRKVVLRALKGRRWPLFVAQANDLYGW